MRLLALLLCSLLFFGGLASCKKNPTNSTQEITTQSSTEASSSIFSFAPTIRVTKDAINQDGSIVFIEERGQPDFRLAKFDLETKDLTTIFQVPDGGWVYQLDSTNQQLVMSYTEPTEETQFDRSGIYILDLANDNVQPELLIGSDEAFVYYYDPVFSVAEGSLDSEFVYYIVSDSVKRSLRVERINIETKAIDIIAEDALWPKVSPDGTSIVYLAINQETSARSLIKAELDGSNPQTLIAENQLEDLDLPFFSTDGEWVYVSVPKVEETSLWQDLLGVTGVAHAHGNHDVPSDWWRVSSNTDKTNSEPEQVTQESVIHYFGDMAKTDNLGFTASKGFYIFDGEESKLILGSRAIRAFTWLD